MQPSISNEVISFANRVIYEAKKTNSVSNLGTSLLSNYLDKIQYKKLDTNEIYASIKSYSENLSGHKQYSLTMVADYILELVGAIEHLQSCKDSMSKTLSMEEYKCYQLSAVDNIYSMLLAARNLKEVMPVKTFEEFELFLVQGLDGTQSVYHN